jgi:hypothetical protein
MELTREEAILAQERKEQENKRNAKKMKIESTKRIEEKEKNAQEEFEKRQKVVE